MSEELGAAESDLDKAVGIVAAYVSHNAIRASDLPDLLVSVHSSIRNLAKGVTTPPPAQPEEPAVPIKKAVTRDYIVCLEDGKKFKSLRRHLSSHHNLTPEQYRAKWGLPSDHPMVAPSYSATRSRLAKDSGLGLVYKEQGAQEEPVEPVKKAGRGRPRKIA